MESWRDERWIQVLALEDTFKEWVVDRRFRNPESGGDVLFKSLPFDEQAKVRKNFRQKKVEKVQPTSKKTLLETSHGVGKKPSVKEVKDHLLVQLLETLIEP